MRSVLRNMGALLIALVLAAPGVAVAQESGTGAIAGAGTPATAQKNLGAVDGVLSLGLTGERRPPYRLQPNDVIEINFTFTPEFNQSVTVQPDGYVGLKSAGILDARGRTLNEFRDAVCAAYQRFLHEPEVSVALKDFERPYFIVSGEVRRPGKYEMRSDTTIMEAVAISGGMTPHARQSQVAVFHRNAGQWSVPRLVNLKKLLAQKKLSEDLRLDPGDLIFVPDTTISRIHKYLPPASLGMYVNPTQF